VEPIHEAAAKRAAAIKARKQAAEDKKAKKNKSINENELSGMGSSLSCTIDDAEGVEEVEAEPAPKGKKRSLGLLTSKSKSKSKSKKDESVHKKKRAKPAPKKSAATKPKDATKQAKPKSTKNTKAKPKTGTTETAPMPQFIDYPKAQTHRNTGDMIFDQPPLKCTIGKTAVFFSEVYQRFVQSPPGVTVAGGEALIDANAIPAAVQALTMAECGVTAVEIAEGMPEGWEEVTLTFEGESFNVYHVSQEEQETSSHLFDATYFESKMHEAAKMTTVGSRSQIWMQFADDRVEGKGITHEGRLYHVREDWEQNPVDSCRVVWYEQHVATGKWALQQPQCDNILCPWDLNSRTLTPSESPWCVGSSN
jgi:hypothetical protein